MHLTVC